MIITINLDSYNAYFTTLIGANGLAWYEKDQANNIVRYLWLYSYGEGGTFVFDFGKGQRPSVAQFLIDHPRAVEVDAITFK